MTWQEQAIELFGSHWKATVAALMGVSKRSVQYWVSGERTTPEGLADKINATYKVWIN